MAKRSPAKILKDKGVIPENWNLRQLSKGQKSWITKLTQAGGGSKTRTGKTRHAGKFRELVKAPGEFKPIKAKTKIQRATLKEAGFPTSKDKAFIRKEKGQRVRWVKNRLVVSTREGSKEYFVADARGFAELLDTVQDYPLASNQVWSLSIDGNEHNNQFRSIQELMNYYTKIKWENENNSKYVTFVLITESGEDYSDGEED